jgi:hypothetical protein
MFGEPSTIRLSVSPHLIYVAMPPRRPKPKDNPGKLAKRMKRRWRIILLRSKGQLLGYVDAADEQGAEAAEQFKLDAVQSRRLLVQELAR